MSQIFKDPRLDLGGEAEFGPAVPEVAGSWHGLPRSAPTAPAAHPLRQLSLPSAISMRFSGS